MEIIKLVCGGALFMAGLVTEYFIDFTGNANLYVPITLFIASYVVLGGEVLLRMVKNIARGQLFDENFLMGFATICAFAIGEYPEAAAVMAFYQVGEYFQSLAVRKSKKSIANLMDIRPDYANILKDGSIVKVNPKEISVNDVIIVKPGEKIPLDGIVVNGSSMLDTAALTGESAPRKVVASDTVLSGCINQTGVLTVKVTKTFGESTASKIIDLVENASAKKAPTENFITAFSRRYTPAVTALAVLIAVVPPLLTNGAWTEWINRGLIFLVISCPCALVISIPLSFFGGIGGASKRGVLVKGGNYLEALCYLDTVVFDKTGTLTKGVFNVTSVTPSNNFTKSELLALAASAEAFSNHPIALSILKAHNASIDKSSLFEYKELAGRGVSVKQNGKNILAGNRKLMETIGISRIEQPTIGTTVYVAVDKVFAGSITISDEIKPDSFYAIAALKTKNVRKTVMLSGDDTLIAETVAKELQIDEVYGELLPNQKVEKIEELEKQKRPKGKIAFVGDGINDAPALARADIGVAMGALGSDAAIEAADVALMTDEPSKLAAAIDIARFTKRVVKQNIAFALGVKGIVMCLGAIGAATMWEAVFADVGVALIAVFNATRIGKA